MKLGHERLDVYEEVAVYEYEYGEEASSAAPADGVPNQLRRAPAGRSASRRKPPRGSARTAPENCPNWRTFPGFPGGPRLSVRRPQG